MRSLAGAAMGVEVSAYVVEGFLVDSGFARAENALAGALSSLAIRGAVITHSHEDHAGNIELLAQRGIPVLLRPETEEMLRRPARLRLYRKLAWGVPRPLQAAVTPLRTDALATVFTPGHSPDHQAVWHPASRTLFSGDLWLGIRYGVMHSWENPYQMVESLRTVHALQPARMFDAHLGKVAFPVRAIKAKIDWLTEAIERIEQEIARGVSDRAIVTTVLGGEKPAAIVSFGEYAARNFVRAVRRKNDAARRVAARPASTTRSRAGIRP